ncbi:MAG: YicC family protein [Planctomycetaceae bacterium]|nr:YicC family protein [Planctomycetaceae bacterium]
MLLSMTGYGDAREQDGARLVTAEVRTVNNRYLKVSIRCPDAYAAKESEIERLVRLVIARGTVNITLRVDSVTSTGRYHIDHDVLQSYWEQVVAITDEMHLTPPNSLTEFLELPGVVVEHDDGEADAEVDWPLLERTLTQAIAQLNEFRRREGASMQRELAHHCALVAGRLDQVAERAPAVIVQYRDKLKDRVSQLLRDTGVSIKEDDLIREVSVFADRCDINEEIARLRSHLVQFGECLDEPESAGRKLEFLCQEMFREVNTIGSKSNDVTIAHAVVDMKGTVEKLRELVQNVE